MDSVLEHTKWNCRYHIVWAPKYRRKIIYGQYRQEIGKIIRKLCEYKGIEIVEANACIDHIHMCIKIPPKYSVAQIMGYLKGKSSLMLFERFQNLKYKYGSRTFWCKGYYVSTVGLNEETIRKYIRNQEAHDKMNDNIKRPD
jgi:putative transposase